MHNPYACFVAYGHRRRHIGAPVGDPLSHALLSWAAAASVSLAARRVPLAHLTLASSTNVYRPLRPRHLRRQRRRRCLPPRFPLFMAIRVTSRARDDHETQILTMLLIS